MAATSGKRFVNALLVLSKIILLKWFLLILKKRTPKSSTADIVLILFTNFHLEAPMKTVQRYNLLVDLSLASHNVMLCTS